MPRSQFPRYTGEFRRCKLPGCGVSFNIPLAAKNKEFCGPEHRLRFHSDERKRALALLHAGQEGAKQNAETQD